MENIKEITIEKNKTKNITPVWKQLINLGYGFSFDNSHVFSQLVHTQKKAPFNYGRICRIFDLLITYKSEAGDIYDYSQIFRILDVLIENHMYPFLELGNKHLRIQFNQVDSLSQKVPLSPREYYTFLSSILSDFMRACINRYGYHSLTHWRFEVCAPLYESPDQTQDFSHLEYLDFFKRIRQIIKSCVPETKVGGPGFNDFFHPENFKNMITLALSQNALGDFVTVYLFPVDSTNPNFFPVSDPNILELRMHEYMETMTCLCPGTEVWVTEFNSNLSSRNHLNDSSYQASFLAHSIFAAIREGISAMGYYLLSDTSLRYADSDDLLFGGWGLCSDNSLAKPSFHAYSLFARLKTALIYQDSNCLITRGSDESYQCLLYSHQKLKDYFCQNNAKKKDFLNPDTIFVKKEDFSLKLVFFALPQRDYIVRRYVISREDSNLFYWWRQFDFLNPVKQLDLDTLSSLSDLKMQAYYISKDSPGPVELTADLSGNQVVLLTIHPFVTLNQED